MNHSVKTYGHVAGVRLGADLSDQRDRGRLGKGCDGVDVKLVLERRLSVVKRLVEDNGGLLDSLGLGEGSIARGAEQEVVPELRGNGAVRLVGSLVVGGKVGNQDDLVGSLELVEGRLVDQGDGGQGLLGHVRDNGGRLPLPAVRLHAVQPAEDLEGGVALDAVLLAKVCFFGAVNLCQGNLLLLERRCCLLVFGRQGLAMATPWGEDWLPTRLVSTRAPHLQSD